MKVSRPGDLVALVPYLLGFRPDESLVAVLVRDGQVLLTARVDLPPLALTGEVTDQFRSLVDQHEAAGLVLFAYSEDAQPARALLDALVVGLGSRGLLDALYVDGRRWWSLLCDRGCCPPEGTPFGSTTHPLAAEAVYAGLTAAPARTAIESQVNGPAAVDLERLSRLSEDVSRALNRRTAEQRASEMAANVSEFIDEPKGLSEADCVRLAVLAADVTVRDVAWLAMTRTDVDDHVDLWGQVVAKTVAPWQAPPLCLLGMAAWISGNGALQNCCSARARHLDPDYSLAALLDEINQRALPPSFWDLMAAEMRGAPGVLAGSAG